MNKTTRYNYDGSTIILNYNNHTIDSREFNYDSVTLLFNGKKIAPVATWEGIGDQHCLKYELPNKKLCIVDLHGGGIIYNQSVSIDGVNLSEMRRNVTSPSRSLEHLQTLAQYPPLSRLSTLDFMALKSMNKGSVVDWPEKPDQKIEFYLVTSDKAPSNGLISSRQLSQGGLMQIYFGDIQIGDNILVVKPFALGSKRAQFIENVSSLSTYRNGARQFIGHMIEGSNVLWTSMDLDEYKEKHVAPILESVGLREEDITNIITASTTIDEWDSVGYLQRFDIEITEQVLERLSNGEDCRTIMDDILDLEQSQDINIIGEERR